MSVDVCKLCLCYISIKLALMKRSENKEIMFLTVRQFQMQHFYQLKETLANTQTVSVQFAM